MNTYQTTLIIVAVWAHFGKNSLGIEDGKNRFRHTPCKLLFSEIRVRGDGTDFIEIGKYCPSPGRKNGFLGLDGYYLLVLAGTNELRVIEEVNLDGKTMQKISADAVEIQAREDEIGSTTAVPNPSSSATLPSFLQPPAGRSLSDSLQADRSLRTSLVPAERLPRSLTPIRTVKRSPKEILKFNHMYAFVEFLQLTFHSDESVVFCLLHYKQSGSKSKNIKHFSKGDSLNEEKLRKINTKIKDILLIGGTPSKALLSSLTKIHVSLANPSPISTFALAENIPHSINKCDTTSSMFDTTMFQYSTPTPGNINACKANIETFKYPYSFAGQSITTHGQKIVVNALWALKNLKWDKIVSKQNPVQTVAILVNLNAKTIEKFQQNDIDGVMVTPAKKRPRIKPIVDNVDEEKRRLIYNTIASFYKLNQIPKFNQILEQFVAKVRLNEMLQAEALQLPQPTNLYHCSGNTFRQILKNLGYKYGKINTRDAVLFDPRIVSLRAKYLDIIRQNDALRTDSKLPVLYTDETWFDIHSRQSKGWVPKCARSVQEKLDFTFSKNKASRGPRIIILHIGGENGFLEGMAEVYPVTSASVKADYHENVHGENYYKWFQKLMNTLDGKGSHLIVIDNAPYHSVSTAPRLGSRKDVLLSYLIQQKAAGKNLPQLENLRRFELESLVKKLKSETPQYRVDALAREYGHKIVRLPPYNCDLNPIELVWADVKRKLREQNTDQNIQANVIRAKSVLQTYDAASWRSHIQHVKKLEETYWHGDLEFETALDNHPELEVLALEDDEIDGSDDESTLVETESTEQAGPSRKRLKFQ
ncbi:unnamed protein product [Allacma fusca]|uniref:Tc1-like transposase DDE domain-containing protein n=1 Tax=Allacma fusca TaxID=39272 RepID=A0A8J2L6N3_9HEXA|nr:unnamed protein product [Allacma fusca]